jgi:hypothetical protein
MDPDNPQNPPENQPAATPGTPNPPAAPSTDEEKVYTRKQYTGLQSNLNRRNEEYKQLQGQFDTINVAKTQAEELANQRFTLLTTANGKVQELSDQLVPLNALSLKVNAFRELLADEKSGLNLPPEAALQLFHLLDDIPAGQDVASTKATIIKFAKFGQTIADKREKEVTEGVTPGFAGGTPGEGLPTTAEGWAKRVANADINDPIWEKYWQWTQTNTG